MAETPRERLAAEISTAIVLAEESTASLQRALERVQAGQTLAMVWLMLLDAERMAAAFGELLRHVADAARAADVAAVQDADPAVRRPEPRRPHRPPG